MTIFRRKEIITSLPGYDVSSGETAFKLIIEQNTPSEKHEKNEISTELSEVNP